MIENWIALLAKFRLAHSDWEDPIGKELKVMESMVSRFINLTLIDRREMSCIICHNSRLVSEFELKTGMWGLMCRRCAVKSTSVPMLDPEDPMNPEKSRITLFDFLERMMNSSIDSLQIITTYK
jgi:hypothetical protein